MKTQYIKKAILTALLGAFSSVQTGFLWDTASFCGNLGLATACAIPAMELGTPVLQEAQSGQYLKAVTRYAKPFATGVAALTLANYIEPKNAGIVMSTCKHALETLGHTLITLPAAIVTQELIQRPLFDSYDRQTAMELACKYLASLGVGFTSLKLSKLLSTESAVRYLRILMTSMARNAITYPTIFLTKKSLEIDETINKLEDPNDRQAALMTFHTFANMFLSGLIG